jgi:hypothetical protein
MGAGIATGYGLDGWGGRSSNPCGGKIFLLSSACRPALGPTQSPIQRVSWALFTAVNRRGREHSLPTSAEVKNTWIYTSTPPYAIMA